MSFGGTRTLVLLLYYSRLKVKAIGLFKGLCELTKPWNPILKNPDEVVDSRNETLSGANLEFPDGSTDF